MLVRTRRSAAQSTLRVGVNGFPASLGNPYKGNGRPGTLIWSALFDALTQLDEQGNLTPSLALSWQLVEPTLWRFELRPGVRYAEANIRRASRGAGDRLVDLQIRPLDSHRQ